MGASSSLPAQQDYTYIVPDSEKVDEGFGAIHRNPEYPNELKAFYYDDCQTLYDVFQRGLRLSEHKPCMGYRPVDGKGKAGKYVWMTYSEIWAKVKAVGAGIKNLDLLAEDEEGLRLCGLYSKNRYEWVVVEQACNAYSGVVVPLYDTLGEEAVTFIVRQSGMRTVFCSKDELKTLIAAKQHHADLTEFKNVVQFEDASDEERKAADAVGLNLVSFAEVIASGVESPADPTPPTPDDVATFCYTSGTTGDPKGAMLSHKNIVADTTGANVAGIMLTADDRHLSYLPLAHMFERLVEVVCWMNGAAVGFYQGDPKKILEDLQALRPTLFPSVPRLFNKIYDKIMNGVNTAGGIKAKLFNKGLEAKKYWLKRGYLEYGLWDKLVFHKVATRLGLDRCKLMVTGSAPISAHVLEFLRVVFSCSVVEGYGQTETAAGATITPLAEQAEGGHVGIPIACNEIRLVAVPDMGYNVTDTSHGEGEAKVPCRGRGEIWYRGPNVFRGYYKNPTKTAEALVGDGWLASGDIAIWTMRGFLKIVDRKKNIFKLAQGEYIAAEKIENVYAQSSFVAQSFVYGDSMQSCLVAIIVPDEEYVLPYCKSKGIAGTTMEEVCKTKELKDAIQADLKTIAKAAKLHSFENAKAIHLEPELWSVDNNMLTPTFKLKRNEGKKQYQTVIDTLYASLGDLGVVAGKAGLKQG